MLEILTKSLINLQIKQHIIEQHHFISIQHKINTKCYLMLSMFTQPKILRQESFYE